MIYLLTTYRNENVCCKQHDRWAEIEIIDGCNGKCVCCPRGIGLLQSTMKVMDLSLYKQIIDKCKSLNVKGVSLFNWSDPFLNLNVDKYCKYAYENNLYVNLSSNLSYKYIDLQNTLQYVNKLEISVSGFEQNIYEINHRGLNIEYVKNNIKIIDKLLYNNIINTDVQLKLFNYDYNDIAQFDLWKKFLSLKTKINIIIIDGNNNPIINHSQLNKNILPTVYFGKIYDNNNTYLKNIKNNLYCSFARKFCINVNGDMVLCSEKMYNKNYIIGNFLHDNIYELQIKKLHSKECTLCDDFAKRSGILRTKDLINIQNKKFI